MTAGPRARTLLLAALLLGTACRFERRPDLAAREPSDSTLLPPAGGSEGPLADSLRATLAAITEAFRLGDGSRVAQLTTRDAVLIDPDDGIRWTRADAAGRLPRALRGDEEGAAWQVDGSSFAVLSDGSALASLELSAATAADDGPRTAVESWVLVRQAEGWRLRYLHRSRGTGPAEPRP